MRDATEIYIPRKCVIIKTGKKSLIKLTIIIGKLQEASPRFP